jgi:hypothetical protein
MGFQIAVATAVAASLCLVIPYLARPLRIWSSKRIPQEILPADGDIATWKARMGPEFYLLGANFPVASGRNKNKK